MTYAPAKFEVATSNSLSGDAFTRKYNMTPRSRSHHVTNSGTKFEAAIANELGGDAFTRKFII